MERLQVHLKVPKEVEAYNQDQVELLRNSPFILRYLEEHQMELNDLYQNVPFFMKLIEEIHECRACPGLSSCVKKEKGHVEVLRKIGVVQWVKTPCRYMIEQQQQLAKLRLYHFKKPSLQQLGITFKQVDVRKEEPDYLRVFNQIVEWSVEPKKKGFYLFGAPGVGKSYLMHCLANKFANDGKHVAFVNVLDFVAQNKPKIDFDLLDDLMSVDLLVLDDIGAEMVLSSTRDELLFTILDARMNEQKWTCFTSNFNLQQLEQHFIKNQYGDEEPMKAIRIMERIKALATEVEVTGKSRR